VYFARSSLCRLLARSDFVVRSAGTLGHWFSLGQIVSAFVPPLHPIAKRVRTAIYLDVGDLFVIARKN